MPEVCKHKKSGTVDLSIMPSLECNIGCSFCMYSAGETNTQPLDKQRTRKFLQTVDWKRIHAVGFYGGEISINLHLYQVFINMIPRHVPKFTITNGSWTRSRQKYNEFFEFCLHYDLEVYISTTLEHRKFQDWNRVREALTHVKYYLKKDNTNDSLLPMGRNFHKKWTCLQRCQTFSGRTRLAITPIGDIIWQQCDGVYPVVGDIQKPFNLINYRKNLNSCSRFIE